jgi:uncharacterized DUF497 family protein
MCAICIRSRQGHGQSGQARRFARFGGGVICGALYIVTDDRFDYGEVRQVAFGLIRERLFECVYVDRDAERRVIWLHKANRRDVTRYGENFE